MWHVQLESGRPVSIIGALVEEMVEEINSRKPACYHKLEDYLTGESLVSCWKQLLYLLIFWFLREPAVW